MKILADENIDAALIRWLRETGHDVLAVAEQAPRAEDLDLLRLAANGQRVLVTNDLDFGELVYRHGIRCVGIILFRLRPSSPSELLTIVEHIWPMIEGKAHDHFVVATRDKIRVRPLPG